jgi:hypothetical protein
VSRNDSIEVLNDATTATSRIDTVLAGQEGLDVDPDITWVPGDPLFDQPYDNDYAGNYREPVSRCRTCDVNWQGDEPCWICGEEKPLVYGMFTESYSIWDLITSMEEVNFVRPQRVYTQEMAQRMSGMFADISRNMEEVGRNAQTAMQAWRNINVAFDIETVGVDRTPDYITYAVRDVEATMHIYQMRMRDLQWVPRGVPIFHTPRRYGGNRLLQLILDEANPPEPPEPDLVPVTWEGTTIMLPREIDVNAPRPVPLPDRIIENTISVRAELVEREYPTSSVFTQERRTRNA